MNAKASAGAKKPTKTMIDAGVRAFAAASGLDLGEAEAYRAAIVDAYRAMDDVAWAQTVMRLKRMNKEDVQQEEQRDA